MNISELLPVDAVIPQLQARDKKQAFKLLAEKAARLTAIPEKEIYLALIERENVGCTGMGHGVCIPHGRFENLHGLHVLFAKLEKPIEFDAPDGKKVDLIFILLTPARANTEHLKALSTISKLLRDKELCTKLRTAKDAAEMHYLITHYSEN